MTTIRIHYANGVSRTYTEAQLLALIETRQG
jgi:hypothetical protein